ncbi:MAG TPA: asparaginase [Sulfurovum sp. UBA12169]|nr:MAG TPA: asparaginase [Sulfurovum sp. UBA12169]
MKKKILLISTGGTFNKHYNPLNGKLEIDTRSLALEEISKRWLCNFEIVNIIGKDSLDITNEDRLLLLATINLAKEEDILIVHGTDTMDVTARYLADADLEKRIVLAGSMVPFSIDPIEATANLASAWGYMQNLNEWGIYIAMNGVFGPHDAVIKERTEGKFIVKY